MFHVDVCVLFAIAIANYSSAFQLGSQGRVMWQGNCDFYGNDIKSVHGIPLVCGDQCVGDSDCSHWTWTYANGGTCWLKNGKTATVSMLSGSNCGYVIGRFSSISTAKTTTRRTFFQIGPNIKQSTGHNALQNVDQKTYKSGQVTPGPGIAWTSWSSYSNFGSQQKTSQSDWTFETPTSQPSQTLQTDQTSKPPESTKSTVLQTSGSTAPDNGLTSAESSQMLASLNSYRAQSGLAALTIDKQLTAAAYVHSKDQASQCAMSHDGSDGSKPWDRIKAEGYNYLVVAENVAAGQASVEDVMASWWNSPGHRENILKKDVTDVGFALVSENSCKEIKTYWTQNFGAK